MKRFVIAAVAATLSLPAFAQQTPPPGPPGSGVQDRGTSSSDPQRERMNGPPSRQDMQRSMPQGTGSHSGTMPGVSGSQAAGMDSATVRQLQQALRSKGHDPGPVDGVWGSQTQSAVRDFQQSQGIDTNGQPNARTLSALGVTPQGSRGLGDPDDGMDRPGATGEPRGTTGGAGGMPPQNESGTSPSGGTQGSRPGSGGTR